MRRGPLLVALFLGLVLLAPVLAAWLGRRPAPDFLYELGRYFGLAAFGIIALQLVEAARFKWLTRPFGLDVVLDFHKRLGALAAAMLILHPVLLAAGSGHWHLLYSLRLPWHIILGKAALALLVLHVALAAKWEGLGLKFERWRAAHFLAAPAVLAAALVHSWNAGLDLELAALRAWWVVLFAAAAAAWFHHKVTRPLGLARHPWEVASVEQEAEGVWTLTLEPPPAWEPEPHAPGQFHFITLLRGRGLPKEEHHWTISSGPAILPRRASTIKESGDFTATIGQTRPGDQALVHGPFGRFSHVFHPQDTRLVMVAGGIGITPLMGMLRHMRDQGQDLEVTLFYQNRSEDGIVFRDELAGMAGSRPPRLRVVQVLSRPGEGWQGETGHLDRQMLERHLEGSWDNLAWYLCAPPPMTASVLAILEEAGVPRSRIRTERFSL